MKSKSIIKCIGILLFSMILLGGVNIDANASNPKKNKIKKFGVITKRIGGKWLTDNPKEGLKYISDLGYREIEGIGNWKMSDEELKAYLKKLKLQPIAAGTSPGALRADNTERLMKDINFCKKWGMKYIVCYGPDKKMKTLDDWRTLAHDMNKGGKVCKENGLQLLYHNHSGEFTPVEGEIPFDVMMSIFDPKYVNIELDLYWVKKANQDPCDYMKKYPGRFPVLHVKDMDKTPKRHFEDLGEGIIDFPEIFALSKIAGVKHYIVENDEPKDSAVSLERGATYLKNVRY